MKAKVLKKFKDKHSGKIHNVGETMTISKERFAEILEVAPLVEEVKETKKAKNTAE
jgi:hypothetical protein